MGNFNVLDLIHCLGLYLEHIFSETGSISTFKQEELNLRAPSELVLITGSRDLFLMYQTDHCIFSVALSTFLSPRLILYN
jgi:hypothetical protein